MRAAYLPALFALMLAGCDTVAPRVAPPPAERPAEAAPPPPPERSPVSFALEDYYKGVEQNLLIRGLLRGDGGGPDVPFDADRLVRTFEEVIFFQEYTRQGDRLIPRPAAAPLSRWESPVLVQPIWGETVTDAARARDADEIGRLIGRLSRASGHPIRRVDRDGSFAVLIFHEDDRPDLGPRIRNVLPEITDAQLAAALDMPRTRYCLVLASDPANDGVLTGAVAIVRAEHPDRLRTSCLHEEIAQGLGLLNDSPDARPSIFSDEEEFGRLTTMDEFLIAMLYDPRLRPGMTVEEARPLLRQIAAELLGETADA